jgi:hypothetical protein
MGVLGMADLADKMSFNFESASFSDPLPVAEKLAAQLTKLQIRDGLGQTANWYARDIPVAPSPVILMTATDTLESAYEIREIVYLSDLVKDEYDIAILADLPREDMPDKCHCTVVIEPRKINRSTLEKLLAGHKPAAVEREGLTFN